MHTAVGIRKREPPSRRLKDSNLARVSAASEARYDGGGGEGGGSDGGGGLGGGGGGGGQRRVVAATVGLDVCLLSRTALVYFILVNFISTW